MIEHYVNQIIAMNILADAVTIIDDKGIIQYYKVFQQEASPFAPSEIIGRHFLDVFTNINPSESSVLKALRGSPPSTTISRLSTRTEVATKS